MNIKYYLEKDSSVSAVAEKEVFEDKVHEELYYADINYKGNRWEVVWIDDFQRPVVVNSLSAAKNHINLYYQSHKPLSNGKSWEIENE